jgi:hypothetical protein
LEKKYKLKKHNKNELNLASCKARDLQEFGANTNMAKKEKKVGIIKIKKEIKLEKSKKIEEEKLEEVLEREEIEKEKFEGNIIGEEAGRTNFNPEILVMHSGQRLEQIELPPEKRGEREKDEEKEKGEGRRQLSYAQTQIEEERNYQGATPLPIEPIQNVIQERTLGVSKSMNLIHPQGFQQSAQEERLYETRRVEEERGGLPWQSGEREIKGARDIKYKVRA